MVDGEEPVLLWIEARAREREAPALIRVLEATARALLQCYPPGQGNDIVWAAVRTAIGVDE